MRVLVLVPTYNEIENIDDVLQRARAALPDADVLVIDDGSPDGTARPRREARRRPRRHRGAAPGEQVGPRLRLPRRVPGRPRPGLRRDDRDGRRPLPRSRRAARPGRARSSRAPTSRSARATCTAARSPTGSGAAAPSRASAASTRAPCSGCRSRTPPPGSAPTTVARSRAIPLDDVQADGYGFQVEMTYLTAARGRHHRRDPDHLPRPHARAVQDVDAHRGRSARARHLVGPPRPASAPRSAAEAFGARARLNVMALHEFTVAGALVESSAGLLLVQNRRRNGAHGLEHAGRRDRRHRRRACSPASRARSRRRPACVVAEWEGPLYEVRAVARGPRLVAALRSAPRARVRGRRSTSTIPTASSSTPRSRGPTEWRRPAGCVLARGCASPCSTGSTSGGARTSTAAYTYDVFGSRRETLRVVRTSPV